MTGEWMVIQNGKQAGPYSYEQLAGQVGAGTLKPGSLLKKIGTETWSRAERIQGLFPEAAHSAVKSAGQQRADKPVPAPGQKKAGKAAATKKRFLLPVLVVAAGLLLLVGGSVLAFNAVAQNGAGPEEEGEAAADVGMEEGGPGDEFMLLPFDESEQGQDEPETGSGGPGSGIGHNDPGNNNGDSNNPGSGDEHNNDDSNNNPGGDEHNNDDNNNNPGGSNNPGANHNNPSTSITIDIDSSVVNNNPGGSNNPGDDNNGGGSGVPYWRAEVHFETIPAGARLFIDGVYVGNTPHIARLRRGTYNITFRKDGYREKSGRINVTSSRRQTLSVSLTEEGLETPAQDPVAKISISPGTLRVNETVRFSGFDSRSPGGQVIAYSWDFCQGQSASGVNVERVFDQPGTYQVRLTVTNNRGNSASETRQFSIEAAEQDPSPPVASFTVSPSNPREGQRITFDASGSSSFAGDIVRYSWVINDGQPIVRDTPVFQNSSLERGDYAVTLTVRDSEGNEASLEKHFRVSPLLLVPGADPLEAAFSFSPQHPDPLDQVTFDASGSSSPHGEITAYYWQFGDGSWKKGPQYEQVTHSYLEAGRYTVTLTIIDAMGNTETTTAEVPIFISAAPPPSTRVSIFVKRLTVLESHQRWHPLAGLRDPRDVAVSCFVLSGSNNDPVVAIPGNILLHNNNFILKTGDRWNMNSLIHEDVYYHAVELELCMIAHHHTSSPSSGPYVSKGSIMIPVSRDQLDAEGSTVNRVRTVEKNFILDQRVADDSPIKARILVELVVIYTLPLPGESP